MEQKNKIEVYIDEEAKKEYLKIPMLNTIVTEEGDSQTGIKFFEEDVKIGNTLEHFIQNDLKYYSTIIFRLHGFKTLLTSKEQEELFEQYDKNSFHLDDKYNDFYAKYEKEFQMYQKQIIDIIEFCLFSANESFENLTPLEKLYIFINTHNLQEYTILQHNQFNRIIKLHKESWTTEEFMIKNFKTKDKLYGIREVYEIDNFYNLLFLELFLILQGKIYLKKCKNCGKYFITPNIAVIYCNNIFEDNKTCREIGASKVFIKNLEKDEAYNLYRKLYKKKQALSKSKGGEFDNDYFQFKLHGKDKRDAYKLGEISKEEFLDWLNKQ